MVAIYHKNKPYILKIIRINSYKDYIPCIKFCIMEREEIEVPKEIREFMPSKAEQTVVGDIK